MRSPSGRCLGVLLVSLCLPPAASAVNLVPNPGFEAYVSCPTTFGQFYQCVDWNVPTAGTSDLFNTCSPLGFPSVSVPDNTTGYQAAQEGVGYAGIIPYSPAADYREYLQAQLTSPLVNGMTYTVSFWISLADTSSIAVDRIGAYLSVGAVGPLITDTPLPYIPQIESPVNVPLNNSTGWTLITGSYVAAGGEDHVIIGSFRDDANTNTSPGPSVWPGGAYYYIDAASTELANPQVDQACCLPDAQCAVLTPGECGALGGTPLGVDAVCEPENPCGPVAVEHTTWGRMKALYRN